MSINSEGLGVRTEDWERACEALLSKAMYTKITQHIRAAAKARNRAENARDLSLGIYGGCATHMD